MGHRAQRVVVQLQRRTRRERPEHPSSDAWIRWGSCIHPADRDRVARDCRHALRGSARTWEAEYLYIGGGGPPRWVHHRAYIVRDRNGAAVRMIGAITDRSDRKNLEEANRTLERFARLAMVGQITASIAHEINQPLGAIRYNAEAGLLYLNQDGLRQGRIPGNIRRHPQGQSARQRSGRPAARVAQRSRAAPQSHRRERRDRGCGETDARRIEAAPRPVGNSMHRAAHRTRPTTGVYNKSC